MSLDMPLDAAALGRVLGSGRDSVIYDMGGGRVLRRSRDGADVTSGAATMEHVRRAGFPVPRVHRVGRGELELDRIDGPTMLADLLHRPWRLGHHARLLADLHIRLHAITAPPWLRPGPSAGKVVVHLDLHPGNVILGPSGPVLIDWDHAARGDGASDVALTWTSLACFDHDATGLRATLADRFRARFLACFLKTAGRDEARRHLPSVVAYRLDHPHRGPNVRPFERDALLRLAAGTSGPDATPATTVKDHLGASWVRGASPAADEDRGS